MNIRQVKSKIKSIGNVKKITKAMQMVSAIKMKKSQAAEIEARPYRVGLQEVIYKIIQKVDESSSLLLSQRDISSDKELIIFVSSNKGLCGSFHVNISRFIIKNINFSKTEFITIGKKGSMLASAMGSKIVADYSTRTPQTEVSAIFKLALQSFFNKEYKSVSVVYNKFISTLKSETVKETILPFKLKQNLSTSKIEIKIAGDYKIEPSPELIIDELLKSFAEEKIRSAIISSEAVEHSSRMIAMKNATDNANDVIYNLTLLGNKIRQGKITSELLDMITAKESVESN